MSFGNPGALWGLSSLILLLLFSLWRQASAKVTVPSLLLWKQIPERNPPVRALRRPRWRLELLLQALAISAAVGALANPSIETNEVKPRKIAFVFDTSARMRAGDRLARMKAKAGELFQDKFSKDVVTYYAALPSPRRIAGLDELQYVDIHVDLMPLIFAATAAADHVVLFSDVEATGTHPLLFGAPADNAGIVEFSVSDDEAFVRLVHHGAPRPLPIELRAGDATIQGTVPAGQRTWSTKSDFSKAPFVRVSLSANDSFPLDDTVEATRLVSGGALVTLTGRHHDALPRVFKAMPGVTVQRGGSGARVAVGWDEAPGSGDLRVFLYSPTDLLKGEAEVGAHPLMHDLQRRGNSIPVGELPPAVRSGQALIKVGGRVAATLRGNEVHLCVDLNAWQAVTPSFPIFWVNVVDYAQKTSRGLTIVRTGWPVQLAPNSLVNEAPPGAIRDLAADGRFVSYTVGSYRVHSPNDDTKSLVSNLLDERESSTGAESKDLTWDPGAPSARVLQRKDLGGLLAWSALAFLILAWLLQLRPE